VPLPELGDCPDGQYYDEESGECKVKVTDVYFVNGVWNSAKDAEHSAELLNIAYREKLGDSYKNEVFLFDYAYNYSEGLINDMLEVIAQKVQESGDPDILDITPFEILLTILSSGNAIGNIVLEQIAEEIAVMIAKHDEASNLSEMLARFNGSLSEGRRVILVAHSQGNLFATQAMELYNLTDLKDSIGMIGVASPASHLAANSHSSYWTAHDDRVINALRLFSNNVLLSNIDNDPGGIIFDGRGMSNHNFKIGYFTDNLSSYAKIEQDFFDLANYLKFPKEKK
jgi:hypothetical protein